jgi:energy-converting hydrogenase Eha subunit C
MDLHGFWIVLVWIWMDLARINIDLAWSGMICVGLVCSYMDLASIGMDVACTCIVMH